MTEKNVFYLNPNKLVIYSIVTFGIFLIYWIYKSWELIKKENIILNPGNPNPNYSKNIDPTLKTVLIVIVMPIIPIIGVILLFLLFKSQILYLISKKIKPNNTVGGLIFYYITSSFSLIFFPVLIFSQLIPFYLIQDEINKSYTKKELENVNKELSGFDYFLVVVSIIIILVLTYFSFFYFIGFIF